MLLHLFLYSDTMLLVMKNVVLNFKKFKKETAIDLRQKGFSYSEIQAKLSVPKSTLSSWLGKVVLNEQQIKKLENRRTETAKANSRKRISNTAKIIEEIKNSSAKDIAEISKREFWLMGIILYWRERASSGNKTDIKNGVRFTSSDPDLIKLFLDWLQEIGGIEDKEIRLDIFIGEDKKESISEVIEYWSKISGFPINYFPRIYYQKNSPRANKRKNKENRKTKREIPKRLQFGFLRIRVKASSMLARQLAGWIQGIKAYYKY